MRGKDDMGGMVPSQSRRVNSKLTRPRAPMPIFKRLSTALLLTALATLSGCVSREYVTRNVLYEIASSDPELKKLRVYPNIGFVAVYSRALGQATDVSGSAGTVEAGFRGKRIEVEVKRKLPGAVIKREELDGEPVLWVSFDERCAEVECAYGFVRTSDGLFRLFRVPTLAGYGEATVYRKRVSPRKTMERTKIYSRTDATAVYFTTRGHAASVGLEVKKREDIDIEVIAAPQEGVRPGR